MAIKGRAFLLDAFIEGESSAGLDSKRRWPTLDVPVKLSGQRGFFFYYKRSESPKLTKNHPKCANANKLLPVMSNQKMNEYGDDVHTARHTVATTVTLTNGVLIETGSKMPGHKTLRTTQQYAKILDQKMGEDMKALKIRLRLKDKS
jgi:hypothetical protein